MPGVELLRQMWKVYASGIERLYLEPLAGDAALLRTSLERVAAAARAPSPA